MPTPKLTSILLSAFVATACVGLTACKKGAVSKDASDRLRWVAQPESGTAEDNGKLIKIPGIAVDFYTPDVLYVYKSCAEASHSPEGPENKWVPVIRCTDVERGGDEEEEDFESDDEEDEDYGPAVMTIFATEKGGQLISERATASIKLEYEQAGFEVESVNFFDEYMAKEGRRGIEILARTVDSETGYPVREIRRFLFPKDDVLFIAHIDYAYGSDPGGVNSDWERILWGFQLAEDGPLYGE
jgi:hypothetical protein